MKILEKIVQYIKKYLKKNKNSKLGENLVIFIIIGIIIIIAGRTFFDNSGNKKMQTDDMLPVEESGAAMVQGKVASDEKTDIETDLEEVLSQINGAGKVTVMVTYFSGKELVPYYDTKRSDNQTDEKDSTGGTRKQTQGSFESILAYEEVNNGVKKPIIVKEMYPQVKGVVVIADGATDMVVKENLMNAVKVLLDVPLHRIQIFQRKN
ncbi:MAG: stage III sporulation protein AG [Clostridiaceae bacterium]|nr:stage III sporulation protein AG [Clostridiaceae bacterium]